MRAKFLPAGTMFKMFNEPLSKRGRRSRNFGIEAARLSPVTDFEYRPEEGVAILWVMTISGYDEEMDGDWPWSRYWLQLWHNTIGHSPPLLTTP
jgi:hypothetical protein